MKDCDFYIFTASLSAFDEQLFEDNTTSRLEDSIDLFETVVNSKDLENKECYLIFTKKDLFEKKIKKIEMKSKFPEYTGGKDSKLAFQFIENKFMENVKGDPSLVKILTLDCLDYKTNETILTQILVEKTNWTPPIKDKLDTSEKKFFWQK
jgi:hypothetical protein